MTDTLPEALTTSTSHASIAEIAEPDAPLEGENTYRLADLRRRQELTQRQVAAVIGVRQPRVSHLESRELDHIEVATLRAYVAALGGRLRVVVEFGDEQLTVDG